MPDLNSNKLRQCLDERNISIREVCIIINDKYKCGMNYQNLWKYIKGREMTVATLQKLCYALQCTPNDIIKYEHLLQNK